MVRRRTSLLFLLVIVALTAACASGGSGGGYGSAALMDSDCTATYDPTGYRTYAYYGSSYRGENMCLGYPSVYSGYTPEYVVAPSRHVSPTEARHRQTHEIHRPGTDSPIASTSGSYSGSGGSSTPAAPVPSFAPEPRMSVAPPSAPAPSPTTIQPRSPN